MKRVVWVAAVAVVVLFGFTRTIAQPTSAHAQLVLVVDGLRPDYITPDVMPRLVRLGQRGIVFNAHHAVVPTVTRVNAASLVTGAYPETHGLLGNNIYVPKVNPTRGLDTGLFDVLESVERAEGRLLTAPSLGEILQAAGKRMLALGSGSSGAVFLLNHAASNRMVVHRDFSRPPELAARVNARFGPEPAHATPNDAQNRRALDIYLTMGLEEVRPDVTAIWISDPDTTGHATGIGSAATRQSLALVDAGIGRVEDTLAAKGVLDRTNIIVTSDHGFSTYTSALRLTALVEPFVRKMDGGNSDIVVSEGAIYLRRPDPARVAAIVAELQRRPEVGAIFTRAPPGGGPQGVVPGTLSFDVVRWAHARSGDILISANWTRDKNEAGFEGKTTQSGVAGHGSSSPYDVHNTLIAAGPDFREHAVSNVPTGTVDLAPTLLHLLGLAIPPTMTGRVIAETLRDGPAIASVRVEHVADTVKTPDGKYELTAHSSTAGAYRYLDFTEVTRR